MMGTGRPEIAATLCKERAARFGARVAYQDGITSWIISTMNDLDRKSTRLNSSH